MPLHAPPIAQRASGTRPRAPSTHKSPLARPAPAPSILGRCPAPTLEEQFIPSS
ncbi:hypothetical protein CALCODRAFT_500852 [Calocera cornea HHB12733]|uniref:Uncharacterized protein n=1 Tax=Calocera cornea HHB12733 TaxID=1353952 RepID=A0A165DWT4_9BASI|nr:hypothetical protein CALCODRAFT_500852 [Calocera cornea HHB12733]